MKKRSILLPLIFSLFLCLFATPALAEVWPASREELAAENLVERDDWWILTGRYRPAAEKLAEIWAQKNYGEDADIRSIERVTTGTSLSINVGKLLEGYHKLYTSTWEIQLIPQTLPDDSKQSNEVYTVSIQVLCLEQDFGFQNKQSTLVGYLPPEKTFRDFSEVWTYLKEDPRFADSLAELRTVVPEGVTEIDLRTALGNEAQEVKDAWMLNTDVCVLLRSLPEDGEDIYASTHYELIVLNMRDLSVLSRTSISRVDYYYRQGREGNSFYLLFEPDGAEWYDPAYTYIKVTVAADGTVSIDDSVPNRFTIMPGGKTAIRTADDGSLFAIDLTTGEETLLIQGVPGLGLFWDQGYRDDDEISERFPFWNEDGEVIAEYVPFWDELPENWEDLPDDSYPYKPNDGDFSIRQFHVEKPLDEHRFVYSVSSWEWCSGYGIYDLQTRADHRITGRGHFFGIAGDTLFGETLKADANIYESSPLPESVQMQFDQVISSWWGGDPTEYAISPDGRLLALFSAKSGRDDASASTIAITDIRTGRIIKEFSINNPFVSDYSCNVDFYSDTRFMLLCPSEELGSAYIYLFNLEPWSGEVSR